MVLMLNNEDVEQVLTIDDCLEVLEKAYEELGRGEAINRARSHSYLPTLKPDVFFRFKSMEGGLKKTGAYVLRFVTQIVSYPVISGIKRQVKMSPKGRVPALILIFHLETGELLAIIQDSYIQEMRVGATSAIAAKCLSRPESHNLGIFGTGSQARAHLQAFSKVRTIREIKVYSPNDEHRRKFSQKMEKILGIEVRWTEHPQEVVEGSDIVIAATNSAEPVFKGQWLEEGVYVNSIGSSDEVFKKSEVDEATIHRADLIVVNSREQIEYADQSELLEPIRKGLTSWEKIHELGEIVVGQAPGRKHSSEIILFQNNVGLGIQFAAVGYRVYELAKKKGLGRDVPDDWFMQAKP